jgi:undecaprenyl diphosphate synthase
MAIPQHIAIIMDGNGRWAQRRSLPRHAGHRAGTENIRQIIRDCKEIGVGYLTLYAFSTENWTRPTLEVRGLMTILGEFIDRETDALHKEGVRIRHLGSTEGLSERLKRKVKHAVDVTASNTALTLAVAFNYGGRADIVQAARCMVAEGIAPDMLTEQSLADHLYTRGMPDPDLVVRTGGEFRLSNFLIWQAAYSEYYSTSVFWPDFNVEDLRKAIDAYEQRQRRFGALPNEPTNAK